MSLEYLDLAGPTSLARITGGPRVNIPPARLTLEIHDVPNVGNYPVGRFGIMSRNDNSEYIHTFLPLNAEDVHSSHMEYYSQSDSSMNSDDDAMDVLSGGSPSFAPGSFVPYVGLMDHASLEGNLPGGDFHVHHEDSGNINIIVHDDDEMNDDSSYADEEDELDDDEDDDDEDDSDSLAAGKGDRCSLSSCDGECYSYALSDASDYSEAASDDDRLDAMARLGEDIDEDRFQKAPTFGGDKGEGGLTYLSRFASDIEPLSAVSYRNSLLFSSSEGNTVNDCGGEGVAESIMRSPKRARMMVVEVADRPVHSSVGRVTVDIGSLAIRSQYPLIDFQCGIPANSADFLSRSAIVNLVGQVPGLYQSAGRCFFAMPPIPIGNATKALLAIVTSMHRSVVHGCIVALATLYVQQGRDGLATLGPVELRLALMAEGYGWTHLSLGSIGCSRPYCLISGSQCRDRLRASGALYRMSTEPLWCGDGGEDGMVCPKGRRHIFTSVVTAFRQVHAMFCTTGIVFIPFAIFMCGLPTGGFAARCCGTGPKEDLLTVCGRPATDAFEPWTLRPAAGADDRRNISKWGQKCSGSQDDMRTTYVWLYLRLNNNTEETRKTISGRIYRVTKAEAASMPCRRSSPIVSPCVTTPEQIDMALVSQLGLTDTLLNDTRTFGDINNLQLELLLTISPSDSSFSVLGTGVPPKVYSETGPIEDDMSVFLSAARFKITFQGSPFAGGSFNIDAPWTHCSYSTIKLLKRDGEVLRTIKIRLGSYGKRYNRVAQCTLPDDLFQRLTPDELHEAVIEHTLPLNTNSVFVLNALYAVLPQALPFNAVVVKYHLQCAPELVSMSESSPSSDVSRSSAAGSDITSDQVLLRKGAHHTVYRHQLYPHTASTTSVLAQVGSGSVCLQ
ncbi:hypothetical protein DFP72DRAFT_855546 [Ephemerocybe angulata]|uniref:Uncharacterized protein n=1 Tax=Ephemerocybe angulata TaxID=980116 RepID=A0A8H6LZ10_9AGAR|nr:hypothetical protein DFP72DRAFT_855546 [Tulosesus angulatus]